MALGASVRGAAELAPAGESGGVWWASRYVGMLVSDRSTSAAMLSRRRSSFTSAGALTSSDGRIGDPVSATRPHKRLFRLLLHPRWYRA